MPSAVAIDRTDDARLSAYADIRNTGTQRNGESFVVEGRLLVQRLIASRYEVKSLLVERGREEEFAALTDRPIYSLTREQLANLVGFDFHRGVLACGQRLPLKPIDQFAFDPDDVPVALAIVGVTELENLGSMLRSAAAFGIRHILIGPGTIDPFSRRVLRVSMGNVLSLDLYQWDNPSEQLSRLDHQQKMRTIATTLHDDAIGLSEFVVDERPMVVVVGNESTGLDQQVLRAASDRVTLPMRLGTDSLNVAVAAAIFMHHLTHESCTPADGHR